MSKVTVYDCLPRLAAELEIELVTNFAARTSVLSRMMYSKSGSSPVEEAG